MKPYELFQITRLAHLLEEVLAIIEHYQEEEVPVILENERNNDHHRQLILPLSDPHEPTRDYFEIPHHRHCPPGES